MFEPCKVAQRVGMLMPKVLTVLFVAGALLLVAISATLSFLFCHSLGTTPAEQLAYGTAAATLDVLKALAPFSLIQRWRQRQFLAATAAASVWSVAVIVSLSSAVGLAAQSRLGRSGTHEALLAQFADTQRQLAEHRQRVSSLDTSRPTAELEAALQAILERPVVTLKRVRTVAALSEACSKPDRSTAEACADAGRLRIELARARERSRLEQNIATLHDRLDALRAQGAGEGGEADRQAGLIMRAVNAVTGANTTLTIVQMALITLMAVALEIGSSCGLYAAIGAHATPRNPTMPSTEEPPPSPESLVERFCAERIVPEPGTTLTNADLYAAYRQWSRQQQQAPMTGAEFAAAFDRIASAYALSRIDGGYRSIIVDAERAQAELDSLRTAPLASTRGNGHARPASTP